MKVTDPRQWTLAPDTLLRRALVNVAGVVLVAFGIAICLEGMVGVDPCTALFQAVAHLTGISYTWMVPIGTLVMLVAVLPFDRSIFGFGTISNMTLAGFLVDTFRGAYQQLFDIADTIPSIVVHGLIGVPIFCLGVSMQICPRVGTIPYDGIAPSLHRRFPRYSYRTYRIAQDILSVIIAGLLIRFDWSLGILGVGTIVMGFFIGVIVDFFNRTVSNRLLGVKGDVFLGAEDAAS